MNPSYCTDEAIAVIDAADFANVCPPDQVVCDVPDGTIGPDGWSLTSQATALYTRGLAYGHIARFDADLGTPREYAVDRFESGAVWLRQKGQAEGAGEPVGAPGTTGVRFRVVTLGPQIARASRDLDQRFGIQNIINGQTPVQLFDYKELEELTALFVLYRQFLSLGNAQGQGYRQTTKADQYRQEFEDRLSRAVIHWTPSGAVLNQPSTRFGCRISR